MSTTITPESAALRATEILRRRHDEASVSTGCIRDLIKTGRIAGDGYRPFLNEVESLFDQTTVLDGSGLQAVRVSVTPMAPSVLVDLRKYGTRAWEGVDFANRQQLSKRQQRDAYVGTWPLSEREIATAAYRGAPLLPSIKGFVDVSLVRRVTGGSLDLTTGQRWLITKRLKQEERQALFGDDVAAWITVGRGRTAEFTTL